MSYIKTLCNVEGIRNVFYGGQSSDELNLFSTRKKRKMVVYFLCNFEQVLFWYPLIIEYFVVAL